MTPDCSTVSDVHLHYQVPYLLQTPNTCTSSLGHLKNARRMSQAARRKISWMLPVPWMQDNLCCTLTRTIAVLYSSMSSAYQGCSHCIDLHCGTLNPPRMHPLDLLKKCRHGAHLIEGVGFVKAGLHTNPGRLHDLKCDIQAKLMEHMHHLLTQPVR